MNLEIHTFGCKTNSFDSGWLRHQMSDLLDQEPALNDLMPKTIHLVNTCAVTAEATREAIRKIRLLKRKADTLEKTLVVVTGCGAQVDTDLFEGLGEADLIVANSHKLQLPAVIKDYLQGKGTSRVFKSNIFADQSLLKGPAFERGRTRYFLKIQDGCDQFCSYCIVPFARGKSRSLRIKEVLTQIAQLVSQGIKEVVLTGIHLADFGEEGESLEELVEKILEETSLARLRLTSLEPQEVTPKLFELFHTYPGRLCRHFHLSIQSGSDQVLKMMKRRYLASDIALVLKKINRHFDSAFVGIDMITGFPGETEIDFEQTYGLLERLPWTRLHVFPYSERKGTLAVRLPHSVPHSIRRARAARLRALSSERLWNQARLQVGRREQVLGLRGLAHGAGGLTPNFWPVRSIDQQLEGGELYFLEVYGVEPSATNQTEPILLVR